MNKNETPTPIASTLFGGWRDMATAPKGEAILVYHILGGHNIARWNSDSYSKKPKPYWDIGSLWGKRQQQVISPMAWMPLPEPPAPKTDA